MSTLRAPTGAPRASVAEVAPVSVIIPAVDEEQSLAVLVPQLLAQEGIHFEILVSDGGSLDGSAALCRKYGVRVIQAPKGRGRQMNYAASRANGELLLFLHADSELPSRSVLADAVAHFEATQASLPGPPVLAAHFSLRFRRRNAAKHRLAYRWMEEKTHTNRPGTISGDQGLLISRAFYERLGGFDESMPFLEDQRISAAIFEHGRWAALPGYLTTSARRFEQDGLYRVSMLMTMIMILHNIELKIFFDLAPGVYRDQRERQGLRIAPFLALVWRIQLRHLTVGEVLHGWYRVGRYALSSSWLSFFFLDQVLRPVYGRRVFPLLAFRDRVFHPLTNNALCGAVVGVLCHVAFCWVLYPALLAYEKLWFDRVHREPSELQQ